MDGPALTRAALTRALAAVVVGGVLVCLVLGVILSGVDPRPKPRFVDPGFAVHGGSDVFEKVTDLGLLGVTGPVVIAAALLLARRGLGGYGAGLVVSVPVTSFLVRRVKDLVERPRPASNQVFEGYSYPSGHSANAVAYTAIALALLPLLPGRRSRAVAVLAGLALTVLVGVSRVRLHAHYITDVLGGWALGAAVFALAALVVTRIRHNPPPTA